MLYQTIGDRIRYSLDIRGMKQREFAKKIGITETSLSRYIYDQRIPRADLIVVMCQTLGVSSDWLLGLIK